MPADAPTIIATSGGHTPPDAVGGRAADGACGQLSASPVVVRGCFLATAMGDSAAVLQSFYDAARFAGLEASHLALFPMPNVDDHRAHLLAQDVVWVWGGSVAGLLAMWRLHGLDDMARRGGPVWCSPGCRRGRSAGTWAGRPTRSVQTCRP